MKADELSFPIKIVLVTIALCCALLLSACGESPDNPQNGNPEIHLQQGKAYLDIHQFKAAYSAANDAIRAKPEQIDGYLLLANIHKQSGQPLQMIKVLHAYNGEKSAEYYFLLLDAYQKAQKFISAQKLLDQQSALMKTQPQQLAFVSAQQLLYSNQLAQAEVAFNELLEGKEYKIESMLALAKIKIALDEATAAHAIIDKIIQLDAKNTEGLFIKSQLYIQQGDLSNAEGYLTQALTTLPSADIFTTQRVRIIQHLIDVFTNQGRSAEALLYSRILADEFPDAESLSLQYSNALELFKKQQFAEAKELLIEIQELAPGHKKSATLLGLILYNEGDPEAAGNYLADIIDPETSPSKLTELYVATQLQQNRTDDLLVLLEYIPQEKRGLDSWLLFASAAIAEKEFKQAEKALSKAFALSPNSPRIALLKSYYYNNLPKPQRQKGLQVLTTGLQHSPSDDRLQLAYIEQLLRLDKKSEADSYAKQLAQQTGQARLIAANYYTQQKQLEAAKALLSNILANDKKNIQALYTQARISEIEQNWSQAQSIYNNMISLSPFEVVAYRGVIRSLIGLQKDPLNAAQHLPEKHQPSLLALTLADFTLQQNRLNLATQYIEQASHGLPQRYRNSLDRLAIQLNFAKALAAFRAADYAKARQFILPSIEKKADDTRLLSLLTRIEIKAGQYNEAKKLTAHIAKILPNSSLASRLNAEIYLAQEKPQQATDLLMNRWQTNKDEELAEQLYLLLQKSNPEGSIDFLNQWQNESSKQLFAMRYKALYLQKEGQYKQALAIYEQILEKAPNEVISLNNAAWLYFQIGDSKALKLAEKAYRLMPSNAAVLDTYGWILFKNGQKSRAKELIEEANRLLPNDASIQQHINEIKNS